MKKFKKSEIAIYAVALMLVAAGYFNYSTFENKTKETYSEDVNAIDEKYANVGDAVLVSSNEIENNENNTNNSNVNVTQEEKEDNEESENKTEETSVQTSNETNEEDYYANAKLERDKMYAEMISNYEKILNNSNSSEAQKSIVAQEITKINNTKNAIMISENLISTKGFENCVILANDSSINVVVKVKDGLDKEKVAKIQNIISRELNTEIENIHITEK